MIPPMRTLEAPAPAPAPVAAPIIRTARRADFPEWQRLRALLWPDPDIDHAAEMAVIAASPEMKVFVAHGDDGRLAGFIEASTRESAEGCGPGPVAYLEGWFVEDELRRSGVGRALVRAVEDWARSRGLKELGSDTELQNRGAIDAHRHVGFEEVERMVIFRKDL